MSPQPRGTMRAVPPNVPRDVEEWKRSPQTRPIQGGGMGAPAAGDMSSVMARSLFVPPPWMYPPGEAGRYIFSEDDVILGAGPVAETEFAGTVFVVPVQNVAVVREINFNVNTLLTTSDITFRLKVNGMTVEGYAIKIFPRAAASVSIAFLSESTVIYIPENGRISVTVQVADAGAYQVGASFRGWFYSKDIHNRYRTY